MGVTFFTGRRHLLPERLLKEIQKALSGNDSKNVIVLVPQQLTLETEMLTLDGLGLSGSFRLSVLSPKHLASLIFDEAGRPSRVVVDERGRAILMGKTLRKLNKTLKWYAGAKDKRGFEMRIVDEISRFKQAGVTPDALFRLSDEAEDSAFKWKIRDLALLYEAYENEIAGAFQDGEDEINEAISRMTDCASIRSAYVFAFGFDLTTPLWNRFFTAIAGCAVKTGMFLPLENDGLAADFTLFEPLQASYERIAASLKEAGVPFERVYIKEDAPPLGAHRHFARQVFSTPNIAFEGKNTSFQAALLLNPMEEARFAAALVRRLVRKNDWRYSDIVVLCEDPSGYADCLQSAFYAYDVPLFIQESRTADRHPLPRFLIESMRLASGMECDLASLLTTGYADITDDETEAILSYASVNALTARSILKPFRRGTPEELQQMEEIRLKIAMPIQKLDQALSHADTLMEQLAGVYLYLSELQCARKGEISRQRLIEMNCRALAAEDAQVWNRVMGMLDQMNELLGEKKVSKSLLTDLIERALANADIKPLPQSADAVNAISPARMGFGSVKAVILIGCVASGGMGEESLLQENESKAVADALKVYLGPNSLGKTRTERMYLKDALSMASEYICVTYTMSGTDGSVQAPGALIGEVNKIFPGMRVRGGLGEDESILNMKYAAPRAAEMNAAVELSEGRLSESGKAALASLGKSGTGAIERLRRAVLHRTGSETLGEALSNKVYGRIDKVSVTRLEAFAGCPFKHFVKYALKPQEEIKAGINARDEGGFLHEAVCAFLAESKTDLSALTQEEAARRMNRISDNILEGAIRDAGIGTNVERAHVKKLRRCASRAAKTLTEQLKGSGFQPMELEMEFGDMGPVLRLNSAASSRIGGRIDRVDMYTDGEERYLRIVDYKRGKKKLDASEMYFGLQLQLVLYLASALKKYGGKSAGAFYFRVEDPVIATDSRDEDEIEKMRLDRMRMDGILPKDTDLIRLMAEEPEKVFKLKFLKSGEPDSRTVTASDEEFRLLMKHALGVASRLTREIEAGKTEIAPAVSEASDACRYCDYKGICMLDPGIPGAGANKLKKMSMNELYEKIEGGQS